MTPIVVMALSTFEILVPALASGKDDNLLLSMKAQKIINISNKDIVNQSIF